MVTLKTAWNNVKQRAQVQGRWHDNRHTFITGLAESGEVGDETIRDISGHVSKSMLKHYSHIRMEAKRRAVQALLVKTPEMAKEVISEVDAKESTKVEAIN